MTLRTASRVSLWLGSLSLAALVLANLALVDIYHGEADPTLEWNVVRLAFFVILAFHAVALTAAWKSRNQPDDPGQQG
jgi:hypothetical protein